MTMDEVSLSMESLSIYECNLGEDLIFQEILPRLDVKSLMRFKTVSKAWSDFISSPFFIADHLRQHSIAEKPADLIGGSHFGDDDYINRLFLIAHGKSDPIEIDMSYVTESSLRCREVDNAFLLGCSNGLVLTEQFFKSDDEEEDEDNVEEEGYAIDEEGEEEDEHGEEHEDIVVEGEVEKSQLVLWNPATTEFQKLPSPVYPIIEPETCSHFRLCDHGIGIGERDCNDYKIVHIAEYHTIEHEISSVGFNLQLQIFSRSYGHWRHLAQFRNAKLCPNVVGGTVIGGFIYWAVLRGDEPASFNGYTILKIDLDTEELIEINGPMDLPLDETLVCLELCEWSNTRYLQLFKWKGRLGLTNPVGGDEFHFWLMGKNGEGSECWTKMFVTTPPVAIWPFRGVFRDRFVLYDSSRQKYILFDPVSEQQTLFIDEIGETVFPQEYHHYTPTLVSPSF